MSLPFFSVPARTAFDYDTNGVVCMETTVVPCRFLVIDDFGLPRDSSLLRARDIEAAGEHAVLTDVDPSRLPSLRALVKMDSLERVRAWAGLERLLSSVAANSDKGSSRLRIGLLDVTREMLALDRDREASMQQSLLRTALASGFVAGELAQPVSLIVLGFPLTLRAPEDCMLLHYVTALGNVFLANTLAGIHPGESRAEELFDWLDGPGMHVWNDLRSRPEAAATAVAFGSLQTSECTASGAIALAIHAAVSHLRYGTPAHMAMDAIFPASAVEASLPPRFADDLRHHGLVSWTDRGSGLGITHPVTLASKGELDLGARLLTYQVGRTAQAMMYVATEGDPRDLMHSWLARHSTDQEVSSPVVRARRPFRKAAIQLDDAWPNAQFHLQLQLHGQSETSLGLTRVSGFGDGRRSPPSPL